MKLTLRATLTSTLVTMILLTVLAIGYNGYRNARFTASDLSTQILDQNSQLVESRVDMLLNIAAREGRLNLELLRDRQFDTETFHRLARFWVAVLKAHPRISRQSLALEATGEWSFVRRLPDQSLAVGELRRDPSTGRLALRDYRPADYPAKDFNHRDDAEALDPRKQHWYADAARRRGEGWSRTYVMDDVEGFGHVPGLSWSTPFYGEGGVFRGVLTTSFDVVALCEFLKALKVGERGFAFIIEILPDGGRRVVAHPEIRTLIREAGPGDGIDRTSRLVPIEELSDPRIAALLKQIPDRLDRPTSGEATLVSFEVGGTRHLGSYRQLRSPESPDWVIATLMPEADVMGRVDRSNQETFLAGLGILLVATVVGLIVSAQLARPLERVVKQTARIGRFEVEARPVAHSFIREIDHLASVVEETKTSLRSFGKYVPTALVREMFASGREATLGGERRRMTISFCDLADFTSLAERLPPEELVIQMGDYFGRFSADIVAEGGTVDKYIGDAIMAFWGAPAPMENHAVAACLTALRNQRTLVDLHRNWRAEGKPELVARIGIMTGDAVVGNVGSPARLNYTVMGDPVNLASRLEGLGKVYGTRVLLGDPTYQEARHAVLARAVDRVSVKGKTEGLLIHELLGLRLDATPEQLELADLSIQALDLYRDRDWQRALALLDQIVRINSEDGPANVLIGRCRIFLESPPADDWDGVHHMATK